MPIVGIPEQTIAPTGVIATPAANPRETCCTQPTATAVSAAVPFGEFVLSAPVSADRGQPILSRTRAITVRGGQEAAIEWQMHDKAGHPVDLTAAFPAEGSEGSESASKYRLAFRIREYLSLGDTGGAYREFTPVLSDVGEGKITIHLPKEATTVPGIYFGEAAVVADNDEGAEYVVFSNVFYLHIDRGLWSGSRVGSSMGPPSIAEIRLHLRDSSPRESYLIDRLRFDDAEIAACIVRPIDQWNDTPPDVARYTTQSFPYRHYWLTAICGYLFLLVAEQFRANNLSYSASGITVDDQNKEPNYERAAQRCLDEWQRFVRAKKAELNLEMAWGGIGSPYSNT